MKGAEIITEYLIRERVPYAVGLCGHGDLGLLDALYDRSGEIRTLSVHHESAAGFIADAYYRIRHQPLATFTSVGPARRTSRSPPVGVHGRLRVPTSPATCRPRSSTAPFPGDGPVLPGGHRGHGWPYVKRSFQATRADQAPLMLRQRSPPCSAGAPGRTGRPLMSSPRPPPRRSPTPAAAAAAHAAAPPRPPTSPPS
jgi:acetolactate synthase-1/2/3 large subunit